MPKDSNTYDTSSSHLLSLGLTFTTYIIIQVVQVNSKDTAPQWSVFLYLCNLIILFIHTIYIFKFLRVSWVKCPCLFGQFKSKSRFTSLYLKSLQLSAHNFTKYTVIISVLERSRQYSLGNLNKQGYTVQLSCRLYVNVEALDYEQYLTKL